MKKLLVILTTLTLVSLPLGSGLLAAPREMSDAEMDKVSGGDAATIDPSTDPATADTSPTTPLPAGSVSSITISGQAQQNLTSLVNIVAINSSIQVMLNLNVSINSTVGSVNQGNLGTQNSSHP